MCGSGRRCRRLDNRVRCSRQLSEVPENWLKLGVGIMLTSFGVFWVGEGAGAHWPGSDLMILVLVALFAATAALLSLAMRRIGPSHEVLVRTIRETS